MGTGMMMTKRNRRNPKRVVLEEEVVTIQTTDSHRVQETLLRSLLTTSVLV